jgi:hypothetical protein
MTAMFMVNPETFFATNRGHGLVGDGLVADDRIQGGHLRLHARDQPTKNAVRTAESNPDRMAIKIWNRRVDDVSVCVWEKSVGPVASGGRRRPCRRFLQAA